MQLLTLSLVRTSRKQKSRARFVWSLWAWSLADVTTALQLIVQIVVVTVDLMLAQPLPRFKELTATVAFE